MTNYSKPAASLRRLPIELLELIFSFLDPRTLTSVAQVNGDCEAASESVCRTKCCDNIPADIFLELWEECGLCQPPDYIKVDNIQYLTMYYTFYPDLATVGTEYRVCRGHGGSHGG